jgi:hypothetical protein
MELHQLNIYTWKEIHRAGEPVEFLDRLVVLELDHIVDQEEVLEEVVDQYHAKKAWVNLSILLNL